MRQFEGHSENAHRSRRSARPGFVPCCQSQETSLGEIVCHLSEAAATRSMLSHSLTIHDAPPDELTLRTSTTYRASATAMDPQSTGMPPRPRLGGSLQELFEPQLPGSERLLSHVEAAVGEKIESVQPAVPPCRRQSPEIPSGPLISRTRLRIRRSVLSGIPKRDANGVL